MSGWNMWVPFAVPLAALFGLLVGSFLNVVIYRVPLMMEREWTLFAKTHLGQTPTAAELQPFNLIKPDSCCPQCQSPVRAWQNIPVISYLLLGGKCGSCKMPISKRYPLVELLTAALFALVAWQYGWSWLTLGGLVLTAMLVALAFIDADTQYLPDQITLPLLWLGLLFNWNGGMVSLQSAVAGAVAGYLSLWLLCWLYKLATGKIGMGGGDFKLLAALGAWLGIGALPVVVFLAALIGIFAAAAMRVGKGQQFAFGPSLAVAGWLVFAANQQVAAAIGWWLRASGF
ncbi:A24 family peptidase [Uruburuella testudinis]|uniref:Prepilin leader peptidase/N-methyltransferase n=1 Tax=Uruburuella testudinis TaxID=1282863 RepID=A0ABY4E042_9NEIS|nr:A24 family peptidase [Uruburuella testudinis]UOO83187.1 A24 family peptidase [Uruburuella testudinis]